MSAPVSIVIPALDDRELLERHLPAWSAECARRAAGDEILVVDDTGRDVLAAWLRKRFANVRAIAVARNGGFASALRVGIEAARHERVFSANPDVLPVLGLLDPLLETLGEADVFAVSPRLQLGGDATRVESWTALELVEGRVRAAQPGLGGAALPTGAFPVAFAIGGACLMRRERFLALGGCDALFEPFYFEDLDLCWRAWKRGWRTLCDPRAVAQHVHRGTIGRVASPELVLAAIEKNRCLFEWEHLDDAASLERHVEALHVAALDALLTDSREALVWIAAALEELQAALGARVKKAPAPVSFAELCTRSDARQRQERAT